jgi:hypothetical protein
MAKINKSTKPKKLSVDFTDVETRVLIPEADYHAKVKKAEAKDSSSSNSQYIEWQFSIVDDNPKVNGQTVYYITSLLPQALWNLRNLLETLGVETPDSEMELELEEYVGLELMIHVEHETYEGKTRARVTEFTPLEETAEVEEEEEKPAKKGDKKPAKKEEEPEEEEEETEEEEEIEDKISTEEVEAMDVEELEGLVKKLKLKVKLSGTTKKQRSIVLDALEKAELLAE